MAENIIVAIIGLIGVALGASVAWYAAIRKIPRELRVLSSEEQDNLAAALNNAVNAYNTSLSAANAQRSNFETRIIDLERVQGERTQTIASLTSQVETLNKQQEAMEREYAKQLAALKRQWRLWYEGLKQWLDEKGLTDYPAPPAELLDTGKHEAPK